MKRKLKFAYAIICILALILVFTAFFGRKYDEKAMGETRHIHWKYVNLRKNHKTSSDIVGTLHEGDSVTLTGCSHNYGDGPYPVWVQVVTKDGKIGWIVDDALQW